jgi:hypothetical protein
MPNDPRARLRRYVGGVEQPITQPKETDMSDAVARARARQILAARESMNTSTADKPSITTLDDIRQAERNLADAERSYRQYQQSEDNMRASLSSDGRTGLVIERARGERLEFLAEKIQRCHSELVTTKRLFLQGVISAVSN